MHITSLPFDAITYMLRFLPPSDAMHFYQTAKMDISGLQFIINIYQNKLWILYKCIDANNSQIVSEMINKGVDPSVNNNDAIIIAAKKGYSKVVNVLLSSNKVDPTVNNNAPIRWATEYGHLDVVQELLTDPRVNPGVMSNYAIRKASEMGYESIVRLLLSDKRVNPNDYNNGALLLACEGRHFNIINLLLEYATCSDSYMRILMNAYRARQYDVLRLLISSDMTIEQCQCILMEELYRQTPDEEMIRFLLSYDNIRDTVNNYECLNAAVSSNIFWLIKDLYKANWGDTYTKTMCILCEEIKMRNKHLYTCIINEITNIIDIKAMDIAVTIWEADAIRLLLNKCDVTPDKMNDIFILAVNRGNHGIISDLINKVNPDVFCDDLLCDAQVSTTPDIIALFINTGNYTVQLGRLLSRMIQLENCPNILALLEDDNLSLDHDVNLYIANNYHQLSIIKLKDHLNMETIMQVLVDINNSDSLYRLEYLIEHNLINKERVNEYMRTNRQVISYTSD